MAAVIDVIVIVYIAESGRKERPVIKIKHQIVIVWVTRMSGLTRDGTAESVSRDEILRSD